MCSTLVFEDPTSPPTGGLRSDRTEASDETLAAAKSSTSRNGPQRHSTRSHPPDSPSDINPLDRVPTVGAIAASFHSARSAEDELVWSRAGTDGNDATECTEQYATPEEEPRPKYAEGDTSNSPDSPSEGLDGGQNSHQAGQEKPKGEDQGHGQSTREGPHSDCSEDSMVEVEYVMNPAFPNLPSSVPLTYTLTMHACLSAVPSERPTFAQVRSFLVIFVRISSSCDCLGSCSCIVRLGLFGRSASLVAMQDFLL